MAGGRRQWDRSTGRCEDHTGTASAGFHQSGKRTWHTDSGWREGQCGNTDPGWRRECDPCGRDRKLAGEFLDLPLYDKDGRWHDYLVVEKDTDAYRVIYGEVQFDEETLTYYRRSSTVQVLGIFSLSMSGRNGSTTATRSIVVTWHLRSISESEKMSFRKSRQWRLRHWISGRNRWRSQRILIWKISWCWKRLFHIPATTEKQSPLWSVIQHCQRL